jgi:hypothetical protein
MEDLGRLPWPLDRYGVAVILTQHPRGFNWFSTDSTNLLYPVPNDAKLAADLPCEPSCRS